MQWAEISQLLPWQLRQQYWNSWEEVDRRSGRVVLRVSLAVDFDFYGDMSKRIPTININFQLSNFNDKPNRMAEKDCSTKHFAQSHFPPAHLEIPRGGRGSALRSRSAAKTEVKSSMFLTSKPTALLRIDLRQMGWPRYHCAGEVFKSLRILMTVLGFARPSGIMEVLLGKGPFLSVRAPWTILH